MIIAGSEPAPEHEDVSGQVSAPEQRIRAPKAPNAFRTISEVAEDLALPQHVLRFWETKFPLVKPLKRGGGRRYYRPDDIALLRRISDLLYIQGYTIKGVQRLLREGGGKLSDDIPPPPPNETAEIDLAEGTELQLPMPGLGSNATLAGTGMRPAPIKPDLRVVSSEPAGSAEAAAEVERLRAVLRETLAELEALRTLLGPI